MPPKSAASGTQPAPNGTAGIINVINVNPAALQPQAAKSSARLKLVVRRLPPGLTQEEFENAFGDDWRVGGGKVDWVEYRQGKIKSPGKHPEQSRMYLHFINESHIKPFEAKFLSITFHDAKGTHRHPDLKFLPPTLEFAPLQRVPASKPRLDSRQGLIDQDPEYMAFLEGETMSIPRAPAIDSALPERTKETVTSTPLIDALREKKAAKAKAAAAKATKQSQKVEETASPEKAKSVSTKGRKGKEEAKPVTKDVKNKETVSKASNKENKSNASDSSAASAAAASSPPARKRERAPANIKSMLQRDLGLAPSTRRGARETSSPDTPATTSDAKTQTPPTEPAATASRSSRAKKDKDNAASPKPAVTETTKNGPSNATPRAPKAKATPASTAVTSAGSPALTPQSANATQPARQPKPPPKPSPGATKAYLKHANASQGITEDLLKAALSQFGEIISLDIDKRKGTALAEYKTPEALGTAMAKRSVPVAQGAVEVLEFKEKPGGASRGTGAGRGASNRGHRGRGGSRGTSGVSSPAPASSAAASPAPAG